MAKRNAKFNVAAFVGGPLDGVTWPCIVNHIDKVVLTTLEGRYICYECDQESQYDDGTFHWRMVLTGNTDEFWQEFFGEEQEGVDE